LLKKALPSVGRISLLRNPATAEIKSSRSSFHLPVFIIFVLVFFAGCASTGNSPQKTGEPKNSIPLFEKSRIGELQSIAVPPFWRDHHNLHETAGKVISSRGNLKVIPSSEIRTALKFSKKDLASVSRDGRTELLSGLGRALQADAVLNGFILKNDRGEELIIQIISSDDARVLWWQAIDLGFPEDLSISEQSRILEFVLTSFLADAGKKKRPASTPTIRSQPKSETGSSRDSKPEAPAKKKEVQPSPDSKPGPREKSGQNLSPVPADISPM
jgi:hypothetical protein